MLVLPVALVQRSGVSPVIPLAWREGQLCVPVTLMGGKPTWFLLDTGCARSFVTRKAYGRLLEAGAKVLDDGTLVATAATIGDFSAPNLEFAHEDDGFQYTVDGAADGYLGMDFLSHYKVGLDLKAKTLRLWPASADPGEVAQEWFKQDDFWSVYLSARPEGYCVPVDVGNLTVPMVVDTGCADTIVHSDVAALWGKTFAARKKGTETMAFYNGLFRVRSFAVNSTSLGGASMGKRTIKAARVDHMVGLLGRDLLSPLRTLVDYPAGKAYFSGPSVPPSGPDLPALDGPQVTLLNGVVVHWPRNVVVTVPIGATYSLLAGYIEVHKSDSTVELVPHKGNIRGIVSGDRMALGSNSVRG